MEDATIVDKDIDVRVALHHRSSKLQDFLFARKISRNGCDNSVGVCLPPRIGYLTKLFGVARTHGYRKPFRKKFLSDGAANAMRSSGNNGCLLRAAHAGKDGHLPSAGNR
jgi:hypothetical protein